METVAVSALLNILVPKLLDLYSRNYSLRKDLKHDIQYIKTELDFMLATLDDNRKWGTDITETRKVWIKQVHKFAQDTEDCIDLFLHPATRKRLSSEDFARKIKDVKSRFELIKENNPWPSEGDEVGEKESNQEPHHGSSEPVGMEEPIRRLLELLLLPVAESESPSPPALVVQPVDKRESPRAPVEEPSAKSGSKAVKRKVVSIVGFNGLGKTRLAKKVYNHIDMSKQFPLRAWVRAGGHGALEVLQNIRKELEKIGASTTCTDVQPADFRRGIPGASTLSELGEEIESCLKGKRYCIVIDDIRTTGLWLDIMFSFPKDADGRIIVTTTMQPVANVCAGANGYVYKMPTLSTEMSENLFFEDVQRPATVNDGLTGLLKKCDGLPLALISVLAYLQSKGDSKFEEETCKEACRSFRNCLINDGSLQRMRDVLVKKYNGLPDHGVRACLLYFYLFPDDNPIKEGSLTRHCLAEGFLKQEAGVSLQTVINNCLETLIDHSIITPIQVSNNKKVKSCRPHGTMLEYISYKSVSENFITQICGQSETHQDVQLVNVRRLFVHDGSADTEYCIDSDHLSLVRTLAVWGNACEAIMDFSKYKLLQVLHLKKCDYQIKENQLGDISELLLLKYLSLGNLKNTISKLPRAIGFLEKLETLEMRKNKDTELEEPVGLYQEVIKLPKLKHLIGKFWLVDTPDKELVEFLSEHSMMENFSGFVIGESRGFARLMTHMKHLRKVKIWYNSNANPENLEDLSKAIREFTTLQGTDMSRSLSIELAVYSEVVLNCLQDERRLTSVVRLKLSGDLTRFLPATPEKRLTGLVFIKELCLSWTKLSGVVILSALSNLGALKDLTLAEEDLGQLVLKPDTFKGLERICLVSKTRLEVSIEAEALLHLVSFHMICKALGGPADVQIGGLASLQEIALHPLVHSDIINQWKEAAQKHGKRPNVLLIESKFRFQVQAEMVPSGTSAIPIDIAPSATSVIPAEIPRKSTSKKLRSRFANLMKGIICGQRGSGTVE